MEQKIWFCTDFAESSSTRDSSLYAIWMSIITRSRVYFYLISAHYIIQFSIFFIYLYLFTYYSFCIICDKHSSFCRIEQNRILIIIGCCRSAPWTGIQAYRAIEYSSHPLKSAGGTRPEYKKNNIDFLSCYDTQIMHNI